jgi:hypothetical protein
VLQHVPCDAPLVDVRPVPAVAVVQDERAVLHDDLGVQPGGAGADDDHIVVALAPEP